MMRTLLTPLLLLAAGLATQAQTYFYIDEIAVQPAQPTTNDLILLQLIGGLAGTGVYIVSADAEVVGPNVTVNIVAADNGGLTVIVPHTQQLFLGQLPSGTYTVTINGTFVGDFAPPEQHSFTVIGDPYPCDSLILESLAWEPFDDDELLVHVLNTSSEIFSYPNFILYDAQGDTLAQEDVALFGIPGDSWHVLWAGPGADLPTGPFQGTLELYTNFGADLACTFTGTWDLCPPEPCQPMITVLSNVGGDLAIGDFAWNIATEQGDAVASGTFTLTAEQQLDSTTTCLPPGNYSITVAPLDPPTGGQVLFGIANQGMGGPAQTVTWTPPVPMPFTYYQFCIDDAQSLPEPTSGSLHARINGNALRVWRADGLPVGPLRLFDTQGRLLRSGGSNTSEAFVELPGEAMGLMLLQHANGTLKVVTDL